jgi:hypothetical protein
MNDSFKDNQNDTLYTYGKPLTLMDALTMNMRSMRRLNQQSQQTGSNNSIANLQGQDRPPITYQEWLSIIDEALQITRSYNGLPPPPEDGQDSDDIQ